MKKLPEADLINEIANEINIDPAFIEKDWYAVQLISIIAQRNCACKFKAVFSGGTSLSKGFNLIKRFSEDLDFVIKTESSEATREQKRKYRKDIIADLTQSVLDILTIDSDRIIIRDGSNFFQIPVIYPINHSSESLRPNLKLEMSFHEPRLPTIIRPINSIINIFTKEPAETEIECISPIETGADKLSALSWRVIVRDRTATNDDPTIIRHLHDLAVLKTCIINSSHEFCPVLNNSMNHDRQNRGG